MSEIKSIPPVSTHASKGGRARAAVLTRDERRDIARSAARTRWAKAGKQFDDEDALAENAPTASVSARASDDMPHSLLRGQLPMGDVMFECHVLNDAEHNRVLTAGEVVRVLTGRTTRPGSLNQYLERIPGYRPEAVKSRTIQFRIPGNPQPAIGYQATLLVEICEMYLDARAAGQLRKSQEKIAAMAEVIVRACAKVGIIALVDEATGYQQVRQKQALQIKLQAFIAEDMQEWVKVFPDEFWLELARLEGIRYSPRNRPIRWGKYVMAFVYDAIDGDVGRELRKKNPNPKKGKNHHQWLREYGKESVHRQIGSVITIMKLCENMDDFRHKFAKVFAKNQQLVLDGLEIDWTN